MRILCVFFIFYFHFLFFSFSCFISFFFVLSINSSVNEFESAFLSYSLLLQSKHNTYVFSSLFSLIKKKKKGKEKKRKKQKRKTAIISVINLGRFFSSLRYELSAKERATYEAINSIWLASHLNVTSLWKYQIPRVLIIFCPFTPRTRVVRRTLRDPTDEMMKQHEKQQETT